MPKRFIFTLALLSTVGCTHSASTTQTHSSSEKQKVFVFESDAAGFNTKTVFYDNGTEVVAFDAQFTPAIARQAIAFLRQNTQNPLTYLVVTHPNPDKFNGIGIFQEAGAKVVASTATAQAMPEVHAYKKYFFVNLAKMFTEETYPKLANVDVVFEDTIELELKNGEVINLVEFNSPGVSSNQTVAMIPNVNALIVGDLIHHKAHAWLEGGIVLGKPMPTVESWIKVLDRMRSQFAKQNPTVYGGRGDAAPLNVAAASQIAYLQAANEMVSEYVTSLGGNKTELQGPDATLHWKALEKAMTQAFPDYRLSYMIQYGVYGLALSK